MSKKEVSKKRVTDIPVEKKVDNSALKKIDNKEKIKKEFKEDKNNKICHYCGEIIYNVLSESSESYCDIHGNWYCNLEEYEEYKSGSSFF